MIELSSANEKEILEQLVSKHGNDAIHKLIFETGVKTASETITLAQFYWSLVDNAEGENMDYWLEKIYNSFHIHISNQGLEDTWDEQIPD